MSHNNKEIAHLWAHQAQPSGNGSHFFFRDSTIYSYGSHFPIARHFKGVVLFTTQGYSTSTARHMSIARQACSHLTVFAVDDPTKNPSGKDVKAYAARIARAADRAGRARNPDGALEWLQAKVESANLFCETFGFKTRFTMPDNLDELREKAKASAERERIAKAARQVKLEAEAKEKIEQWLAGAAVSIPYQVSKTYLRSSYAGQDSQGVGASFVLETSRGAKVPLADVERAFRFAMIHRARGWKRNGEKFTVGSYELDAVNEQGVIAGCHRIAWDEVERFAKTQGWI